MKYKWQLTDEVVLDNDRIGKIKSFETSTVDNKQIPSYWIVFSKEVFPDGQARNIWESSIKKLHKRQLKFKTIDDWNRPVFKDHNDNLFGSLDILFSYGTSFKTVIEKVSEKHICYFGRNIDDDPMGTVINPDKIKLVKEWEEEYYGENIKVGSEEA